MRVFMGYHGILWGSMGLHSKTVVFPGVAAILAWVMVISGTKRDRIACRTPYLDLAPTILARQWGEMMFFFCSRRCRSGIGKNARRPVSRVLSRPLRARDDHSSGTSVAGRLARPTRAAAVETRLAGAGPEGPVGRPPLCGLAPGGVCPATAVAGGAVRSYRTLSPLPAAIPKTGAGGLLSVALSLGSPPPGVTRHRVSVEPGLSSPRPEGRKAAIRPSGGC